MEGTRCVKVAGSPKKGRGQKGFPTNSLSESRICGGPAGGRRGRCFEAPEFIRGEDNKTWSKMRSTRYNTSLLETPTFIYGVSFCPLPTYGSRFASTHFFLLILDTTVAKFMLFVTKFGAAILFCLLCF